MPTPTLPATGRRARRLAAALLAVAALVAGGILSYRAIARSSERREALAPAAARAPPPGLPALPAARAGAERGRGNPAEAGRLLDEVLAADPADATALVLRGMTHARAGEPEKAVAVLRRVPTSLPLETREVVLYPLARALHDL